MTPEPEHDPHRVVAGIDGSPSSLEALSWAARQADLTGTALEVVMTWEWPQSYGWAVPIPTDFNPEDDVRRAMESAADEVRAKYPSLRIDTRLVNGHPAPILVEASKEADLLVVGSRGHGAFVGMLIGSVSEYCATNAHCPVLVHRSST
jgi:nucleotide-binding universal stress UspA family protein